jgi:serine/threonine protein kinase
MDDFDAPQLPGFTVVRELGRGGSSTVWLVTEERTGRDFALKCLLAEPEPGPAQEGQPTDVSGEEAIRREVRILSVLDHQHLVKAHDAVRFGDSPAGPGGGLGLLVDYAPGGSLEQLVTSRGKLSVGETVTVLTPIAQVLGYLHGRGFTHSDVSPGNVLFTGHGKPMLSDLGIARMVGDASAVPDLGTAGFMDPAPVDAVRAGLQPERDVYSVAALGWYCLTGEPPRRTVDRLPLSLLLPEVPGELAAALEAGLNEDRRLRPTAVELATAVYRSASPLPVDLAASVHATVIPELLTRRRLPERSGGGAVRNSLRALGRRISTSRWSVLLGARQVLPFPEGEGPRAKVAGNHETETHSARGKHSRRASRPPGARPRHGRAWGNIRLAAAAASVVAGGIWAAGALGPAGLWSGPAAGEEPSSVSSNAAAADAADTGIPDHVSAQLGSGDPVEAVQGLAWIRSRAFSSGRLELLDQVNAPGSAAFAADEQIRGRLRASGHVLAGFTGTLSNVQIQPGSSAGRAVVGVTSATSSYEERDPSGTVVAAGAAREGQELRLVLVPVDGRWRIMEILPGP